MKKSEIISKLKALVIAVNTYNPVLSFTEQYVITQNNYLQVMVPNTFGIKDITVDAQILQKTLQKFPADDVVFEIKGDTLQIKHKKKTAWLSLLEDKVMEFQDIPEKYIPLPETFIECMQICIPICSTDNTFPAVKGILIKEDGRCYATDRKRIIHQQIGLSLDESILLSAEELVHILPHEPLEIAIQEHAIWFKTSEDILFRMNRLNLDYPDAQSIFESLKLSTQETTLPIETKHALNAVRVFTDGLVDLQYTKRALQIECNTIHGGYKEKFGLKDNTLELSFSISVALLEDLVSNEIAFNITKDNRVYFNTGTVQYIGMLQIAK